MRGEEEITAIAEEYYEIMKKGEKGKVNLQEIQFIRKQKMTWQELDLMCKKLFVLTGDADNLF